MPNQLLCMSDSSGDDRHTVGLVLPIDDNEFADLLQSVQSSQTSAISETQGQHGPLLAPVAPILPNVLAASANHVTGLPTSPSTNQEKQQGKDWMDFEWMDGDYEYIKSWNSMNDFKDRSHTVLANIQFDVKDDHLSNFGGPVNSWFHQIPITPTPSLPSTEAHSPISQYGNQEELEWAEYISMPQEDPTTSRNIGPVEFNNDGAANARAATSPPVSFPSSPSFPTAPILQLPVKPNTVSPPITSTAATATGRKTSSIQKRQRLKSISTSHLRPKFNSILPSTSNCNDTPPLPGCNPSSGPGSKHKQDTAGRARRSSKSDEESLRKRRTYQRLAEQNRRQRLNSALKDLEALLPSNFTQEKNKITSAVPKTIPSREKREKAPSADQTKVCVMERAIEYIKMLRTTLNEKNVRMKELGAVSPGILM